MSAYRTYIWGLDALFFDSNIIELLKDHLFWWRMSYIYVSIWRNLHIDGFEGYLWSPRLPRPTGDPQKIFFTYSFDVVK